MAKKKVKLEKDDYLIVIKELEKIDKEIDELAAKANKTIEQYFGVILGDKSSTVQNLKTMINKIL